MKLGYENIWGKSELGRRDEVLRYEYIFNV